MKWLDKITGVEALKGKLVQLQAFTDDLTQLLTGLTDDQRNASGNPYCSYELMVNALSNKFQGLAKWGNQILQNIVNVRAAFIISAGVVVTRKKPANTREVDYINEFLGFNNLDEEMAQEWAREAQIEGKILIRLIPDVDNTQVKALLIPWTKSKYKVITDPTDYTKYNSVEYEIGGKQFRLDPSEFVFVKFSGRVFDANECSPSLGFILKQIEDLDKALWDWRKINSLFASPTPHFKTETRDDAERLYTFLQSIKWRIGKILVTNADFEMVGITGEGVKSIEAEIKTLVKIISGNSGVPPHFLGLPDIMANRATADNLIELILSSTSKDKELWKGCYEELSHKVLTMANEEFSKSFTVDSINVDIPQISSVKMQELLNIWLPLYEAGCITLGTLLKRVPAIDPDKEEEALKKAIEEKEHMALRLAEAGITSGSQPTLPPNSKIGTTVIPASANAKPAGEKSAIDRLANGKRRPNAFPQNGPRSKVTPQVK